MKNKLVVRSRNVLKRNALRFAAAPHAALTQAPQHHDQVPAFYRQKVGDLEVTALFDGHGVFDPHWLNGTKATMDGVAEALHEDPRLLDVSDEGFLVNTGKQLILVDAGAGTWWGGGALGRLLGSLRSAGYTPEQVDIVLVTHLHSDHVGGLTTDDGKRVQLQHPEVTAIFDIDQNAAAATRLQLLPRLAREHVLIAGPHMPFPALGSLRKEGSGYSWVPVVFTDQWVDK